jgi:hypothetical protein
VALLFVDGCSHYATDDAALKWQYAQATIVATNPRRPGSKSIVPYENFWLASPYFGPCDYLVCGAAITTIGFTMSFTRAGSVQIQLRQVGTELRVYRGNYVNLLASVELAGILVPGEWYYYELGVRVHDTEGTVSVRLNGIVLPDLTLSGVDTKDCEAAGVDQVQLGGSGNQFTDIYIDNESFHGDCIVETLYPTGAGNHSDWIPSGGLQAGSNYLNVDDPGDIDGDDTYNMSLSQGDKDSFVAGNLVSRPTSVIKGVAMHLTARKDEAGSREMKPMLRIGGVNYVHEDTGFILSDVYHGAQRIWEENPATEAAWTESGVNGAEIGYDLVTGS